MDILDNILYWEILLIVCCLVLAPLVLLFAPLIEFGGIIIGLVAGVLHIINSLLIDFFKNIISLLKYTYSRKSKHQS